MDLILIIFLIFAFLRLQRLNFVSEFTSKLQSISLYWHKHYINVKDSCKVKDWDTNVNFMLKFVLICCIKERFCTIIKQIIILKLGRPINSKTQSLTFSCLDFSRTFERFLYPFYENWGTHFSKFHKLKLIQKRIFKSNSFSTTNNWEI